MFLYYIQLRLRAYHGDKETLLRRRCVCFITYAELDTLLTTCLLFITLSINFFIIIQFFFLNSTVASMCLFSLVSLLFSLSVCVTLPACQIKMPQPRPREILFGTRLRLIRFTATRCHRAPLRQGSWTPHPEEAE